MSRPRIRAAEADDVSAMAAIYDEQVLTSIATFDTEPGGPARLAALLDGTAGPVLVAEEGGRIVGYAYAAPFRPRPAYRATREVTIYLDATVRGRGIGRVLYAELLDRLDADPDVHTLLSVIALPNDASERLHRSLGFERSALLREVGRKFDRWIDIAIYQRRA